MHINRLLEKIEESNPIDFGGIFSKSFELFQKILIPGFIHSLISMVLMVALVIIMYVFMMMISFIAMAGAAGFEESFGTSSLIEFDQLSIGLMILFVMIVIVISVLAFTLQFAIVAHFYRICKQEDAGQTQQADYFMFFKGKYLKKISVLSLAMVGIIIVSLLLCFLPLLYVIVPLQLMGVVFSFNPDLSVSDVINASFKLGNKIWLMAFLLIFVTAILVEVVGSITCGVGFLFIAFFVRIPVYYMYKDTIGFEEENESKNVLIE